MSGVMNENILEDIYPLSPMQQGMLFHSLYAPDAAVYVEQLSCASRVGLMRGAFAGLQHAVDRHPVCVRLSLGGR